MSEFWSWFDGKKTYIAAALTTVLGILQSDKVKELGLIPESWQGWFTLASMLAGGLTVLSARSAGAKIEEGQVDLATIQMRDVDDEVAEGIIEKTESLKRAAKRVAKSKVKAKAKGKT